MGKKPKRKKTKTVLLPALLDAVRKLVSHDVTSYYGEDDSVGSCAVCDGFLMHEEDCQHQLAKQLLAEYDKAEEE